MDKEQILEKLKEALLPQITRYADTLTEEELVGLACENIKTLLNTKDKRTLDREGLDKLYKRRKMTEHEIHCYLFSNHMLSMGDIWQIDSPEDERNRRDYNQEKIKRELRLQNAQFEPEQLSIDFEMSECELAEPMLDDDDLEDACSNFELLEANKKENAVLGPKAHRKPLKTIRV